MFDHRTIKRALTGALALAAVSLPATAQASPARDRGTTPAPRPTATSPARGFQWDDAGIGAGGAILLLGAGGTLATGTRRRRTHRTAVG